MKASPKRIACLLLLALMTAGVCMAAHSDFSEDIAYLRGNPSPSQSESNINDYTYQDEQINIDTDADVVKVLRVDQKNLINQFVPKLIPISRVSARELRPIARAITAIEGGYAQIVQDKKKKQYFVLALAPPWQMPYIEKAIQDLDVEWLNATDDGSAVVTYQPKHRDAAETTAVAEVYAGGSTVIDELDNKATHLNDPGQVNNFLAISEEVDIPAHEITVATKVYEVTTNNDSKIGLDYIAWKNGPGRNLFEFIFAGIKNREVYDGASSIYNPLTPLVAATAQDVAYKTRGRQRYGSYNYWLTSAYVDFMRSKGQARVKVQPTLTATSGDIADWMSTDQVLSFAVTGTNDNVAYTGETRRTAGTSNGGDLGAWDRFVNYVQNSNVRASVYMAILPYVGKLSTELYYAIEMADVSGLTPAGAPMVSQRELITAVRVRDGETLAVSGLTRNEDVRQKNGMPWLSDLPVLGYVFGGETTMNNKTDVVVTLDCTTNVDVAKTPISAEMATVMATVTSDTPLNVPTNPFGFDQWLLDK